MADRDQLPDPKQSQSETAGKRGQVRGDRVMGKPHGSKQPIVGNDVPDESKERHTEIAVEAGRHDGERRDDKH